MINLIKKISKKYKWLIFIVIIYFIAIEAYPRLTGASGNNVPVTNNLPQGENVSYNEKDIKNEKVNVSATVDEYIGVYKDAEAARAETNSPNGYFLSGDSLTSKF